VPTTNVVLVESAVLDERLVDLDGVDAEPRRPRGVVELDRMSECGLVAVTQVETWVHWLLPGSGPKLTDDDRSGTAEQPQGHMAPRAG